MAATCVFCDLLEDRAPAEWITRGPEASALLPRREGWLAPGHTLIITNEHAVGVQDASPKALQAAILLVRRVARAMRLTMGAEGVNVLNASGPDSDQSVPHLHFHVVPRWPEDGLDTWVHGRSRHPEQDGWLDQLRTSLTNPEGTSDPIQL